MQIVSMAHIKFNVHEFKKKCSRVLPHVTCYNLQLKFKMSTGSGEIHIGGVHFTVESFLFEVKYSRTNDGYWVVSYFLQNMFLPRKFASKSFVACEVPDEKNN